MHPERVVPVVRLIPSEVQQRLDTFRRSLKPTRNQSVEARELRAPAPSSNVEQQQVSRETAYTHLAVWLPCFGSTVSGKLLLVAQASSPAGHVPRSPACAMESQETRMTMRITIAANRVSYSLCMLRRAVPMQSAMRDERHASRRAACHLSTRLRVTILKP